MLHVGRRIVKKAAKKPVEQRIFPFISSKASIDTLVPFRVKTGAKTCFFIPKIEDSVRIFWIWHINVMIEVDDLFPENVMDIFF
ncbi:hypothetical protein SDC9_136319 [bioreactor metagenome]|uniref:Uncharacterized protein n=1 Tax=bioreactor metagenome TaxID=1076179 RepID=A0A645DIY9_9ZZZZ